MRHAAYLITSRHGIFYFRFPLPHQIHPQCIRSDVKLSVGTRDPMIAQKLSRVLVLAGQSAMARASNTVMRYDEIRRHVQDQLKTTLAEFRDRIASDGPLDEAALDALRATQGLAENDLDTVAPWHHLLGLDNYCRQTAMKIPCSSGNPARCMIQNPIALN